jgi:hypothetical protein
MKKMREDPIVKEVRATAAKIAKECDNDPHKMFLRWKRLEKRLGRKMKKQAA